MIHVERELRHMFARRERDAVDLAPGRALDSVLARTRRRQVRNVIVAAVLTAAIVVGSFAGARTLIRQGAGGRPPSQDTGAVLPEGTVASLTQQVRAETFRVEAVGTANGRLCFLLRSSGVVHERSCLPEEDLVEPGFVTLRGLQTDRDVVYGIASPRAAVVELRYDDGGTTSAAMTRVSAGSLELQVFLFASPRRYVRGALGAWDAAGNPVGESLWEVWGTSAPPNANYEGDCACKHLKLNEGDGSSG